MELIIIKNGTDIIARTEDYSPNATYSLMQAAALPARPAEAAGVGYSWRLSLEDNELVWARVARPLTEEEKAEQYETLCPEWEIGVNYTREKSVVVRFGSLYVCLQSHTSQADYAPEMAPALWSRIRKDWDEWEQPAGAEDSYRIGAKVTYESERWVNEYDFNVYAPGVYGWVRAEE